MMLYGFQKIVEERIKMAQREGEFDDLPGAGKPLVFDGGANVPEDLRIAYKMLKNADCLPPEIELKNEIRRTERRHCGKSPSTGYALERRGMAKKKGGVGQKLTGKTKRRFLPNLQRVRIRQAGGTRRANVCTRCIKSNRIVKAG